MGAGAVGHLAAELADVLPEPASADDAITRASTSTPTTWTCSTAFALGERNALIWGLGYRHYRDDYRQTTLASMNPSQLDYGLFSAFVQDQISLVPRELELTLGARLERNDFTGWEFQPNARLLWTPHPRHRLWGAVSRAVRTPSRAEDGMTLDLVTYRAPPLNFPVLLVLRGDAAFDSETLTAYELGYRVLPSERLSLDFTAFYNDYDRSARRQRSGRDLATVVDGNFCRFRSLFV
ncbi:MAG: TonB-dependent receptor [Candidatus Competibacter sp.]